jgi:hypothetical protein
MRSPPLPISRARALHRGSLIDEVASAMPFHSCPECEHPAPRFLVPSKANVRLLYYCCDNCGLVFALDKHHPLATVPPLTVSRGAAAKQ